MIRPLLVAAAALIVAAAAFASPPTTVTVTQGTLVAGDAQSLAATDGDVLSIQATPKGTRQVAALRASYPAGASGRTLHWRGITDNGARCRVKLVGTRSYFGIRFYTDWKEGDIPAPAEAFTITVTCKSSAGFTVSWDELSVSS